MNRLARLAAVIVPGLGLAVLWATSHQIYNQGTDWEVPIDGYDPRDYLRGHYVEFSYDWPGIDESEIRALDVDQVADATTSAAMTDALCLEGTAPRLTRARWLSDGEACAHPVRADKSGVYGTSALVNGRLYVEQDRARALDVELRKRDQNVFVTIRQRDDGSFTPIAIRFQPFTPEERELRNAQDAAEAAGPVEPSGNPRPLPQSAP